MLSINPFFSSLSDHRETPRAPCEPLLPSVNPVDLRVPRVRLFFFLFCTTLIFLTSASFLHAQPTGRQSTADEIETLLNANTVTYAQAARFVLEASDVTAIGDPEEAFNYAAERKWLPNKAAAGDAARFDAISLLLMRFLLEAADVAAIRDPEEAFRYATQRGWLPPKVSANNAARLDAVCLLLMRSFDIRGGILYTLTKSPHYAYRELTYRNTVQGRADPGMNVSGELLLFLTGRILQQFDGGDAVPVERETVAEATVRREELAAEINAILEEQNVANTVAEATEKGVVISLSNIQFAADSAVLIESEMRKIREIANILKTVPGRIFVAGHTALAGSNEGHLEISLGRARAVADYLVSLGARGASEITAAGYGAGYPIADNSTEEGRARNRRVEITILEN